MKVFLKWTTTLLLLGVLAYSGVWLEKKKINAMVEFPEVERIEHGIDTIVVYKDGRDYDWEIFTQALIWVESRGDSKAVGSKEDGGFTDNPHPPTRLQPHPQDRKVYS